MINLHIPLVEGTEAQRSGVTCPRSHSKEMESQDLNADSFWLQGPPDATIAFYHFSPQWLQSLPNQSPSLYSCLLFYTAVPQCDPSKTQIYTLSPCIVPFGLQNQVQALGHLCHKSTPPPSPHTTTPTPLSCARNSAKISGQCKMWLLG